VSNRIPERAAQPIHIVGAGPAGLAAALTIASAGGRAVVHEQRTDVGGRFQGDLQGIENWTTAGDVLEELASVTGADLRGMARPVREGVFFNPAGREYRYRSPEPLFYLVRRGPGPGTLDDALKSAALTAGVEIRFREPWTHLSDGGIVAGGPRAADVVAVGYVFETDRADGVYGVLSDRLAPKGYAYLLVCGGRGTVATCLFGDFAREAEYLDRTVAFFRDRASLQMRQAVRFGGAGNILLPRTARQGGILFAGEAAGFQDALWGFGIRIGMISGHLAARALLECDPERYDHAWRRRLGGLLRASLVNRYAFSRMGDAGYGRLMRSIAAMADARQWLRRHYSPTLWKRFAFPLIRWLVLSRREPPACAWPACDRIWCKTPHVGAEV
jgi:flavin-dependent dehydrogenase